MQTLRVGSTGPDVLTWQKVLGALMDGVFGPTTELLTKQWQKDHGLEPDGIVGSACWKVVGSVITQPPPPRVPVQGTDISVVQGTNVPFELLKKQGHEFTWIRCKVGNNVGRDMRFLDNYKRALFAGLLVTPYEFFFALPHINSFDQVHLFVEASMVDGHLVGSARGELPPAMDLEWPPPEEWAKHGCSAEQIVDDALTALGEMTKQWGRKPKLYSYPYFLKALSGATGFSDLTQYGLWLAGGAQYVNGDGHVPDLAREQPPTVAGWGRNWQFWQHDGNGGRKLPNGIDADFNVFRGTLEELQELCQEMNSDTPSNSNVSLVPQPIVTNLDESADYLVHTYRMDRAQQIFETEKV